MGAASARKLRAETRPSGSSDGVAEIGLVLVDSRPAPGISAPDREFSGGRSAVCHGWLLPRRIRRATPEHVARPQEPRVSEWRAAYPPLSPYFYWPSGIEIGCSPIARRRLDTMSLYRGCKVKRMSENGNFRASSVATTGNGHLLLFCRSRLSSIPHTISASARLVYAYSKAKTSPVPNTATLGCLLRNRLTLPKATFWASGSTCFVVK